jgi:hypothetical protein
MSRFTWGDTVRVTGGAASELRPGRCATVVSISLQNERRDDYLARFPSGVVYAIEFEDGSIVSDVEEDLLEKGAFPSEISNL